VGRALLFLFLVVLVPAAVYWGGNGMSFASLPAELRELREPRPEATPAPAPEQPPPEPEREPEPEPEPPPPTEPPTPKEAPRERAERLYREGDFAQAAAAFQGVDERRHALAELGATFVRAFPPHLPDAPYAIVETRTGESYEGFTGIQGGLVTIVDVTGKSLALPESAIATRRDLAPDAVRERIARQAADGVTETSGPRVFALIQAACAVGRPDAAAPLLARALELDEKDPYFLRSIRGRVGPEWQKDMYRAFATAQAPVLMAHDEPVVKVPSHLGGRPNGGPSVPESSATNPKVRELMREAAPYRKRGEQLYREIVLKGADASTLADVNAAIEAFDKALALYEKAVQIEESDALYAVMQSASRLNFHLRFWRQQLEGR